MPKLSNVIFVGAVERDRLPAYLNHADVGIIPFNCRDFLPLIEPVRPLKLYEYMACGLPVVSVAWQELRQMNSPAWLAETIDEFIAGVDYYTQHPQVELERARLRQYAIAKRLECEFC